MNYDIRLLKDHKTDFMYNCFNYINDFVSLGKMRNTDKNEQIEKG